MTPVRWPGFGGELERASAILGVTHLEMLGYHDSGMPDWEYKDRTDVFANVPLEESTERLVKLYDLYRPDVIVTYDEQGGYNHPDHIRASQVAMAALEATSIPRKAYLIARRRRDFAKLREILEAEGVELPPMPQPDPERLRMMEAAEARITTSVDVSAVIDQKRTALDDPRQPDRRVMVRQAARRRLPPGLRSRDVHPGP